MSSTPKSVETGAPAQTAGKVRVRAGVLRHSVAWLLGALLVLFVAVPFLEKLGVGRQIEGALMTAVLAAAVLAVGGRRRTLALAIWLAAPAVIARWTYHFLPENNASYSLYILGFLIFVGFVVFHFLRFILLSPRVNSEVLCAAVSTYLLLGLLWAAAYAFVARINPGAFSVQPGSPPFQGFSVMYYSLLTLTTVGYGDITPVSGPARMLAMMEAVTGTMYMAMLVARLVSVYSSEPRSGGAGGK